MEEVSSKLVRAKAIYDRLSSLESQREEARLNDESTAPIDLELSHLRELLKTLLNSTESQ